MSDEAKKTKPGPEPERLVIEDDPAEALDRLLGKNRPQVGEWVAYKPPLPPGWYDVEAVVGEDAPLTGTVVAELRDTGWRGLDPHARILRVRRRAGPPR